MSGLKQTLQMSRPPLSELKLFELNWSRPDTAGNAVVNFVSSFNLGFTFSSPSPHYPVVFLGFLSISTRISGALQS